jgi:UrcA family protein
MSMPPYRAAAIAALLLAAAAPVAQAQPVTQVIRRVPYGDLDLATAQGARVMLLRIRQTAATACAQPRSAALPRAEAEERRCQVATVARAVSDLGSARVAALYGKSRPSSVRLSGR